MHIPCLGRGRGVRDTNPLAERYGHHGHTLPPALSDFPMVIIPRKAPFADL